MIDCPNCGGRMEFMVQATIKAPMTAFHNLTKTNLRHKDTFLAGVNWETADLYCTNYECLHVINRYGNYVSRLEKRVKELEAQLQNATNEI